MTPGVDDAGPVMPDPIVSDPCGGHSGMSADLCAAAVALLDRVEPVLERLRSEPGCRPAGGADPTADRAAGPAPGGPCTVCPVCAVVSLVRGERPQLGLRLVEQAVDLVAMLRAALAEQAPVQPPTPPAQPPARPVQHIPVTRP